MSFCPNCGTKVPDGAAFCSNCGAKLAEFASPNQNASVNVAAQEVKEQAVSTNEPQVQPSELGAQGGWPTEMGAQGGTASKMASVETSVPVGQEPTERETVSEATTEQETGANEVTESILTPEPISTSEPATIPTYQQAQPTGAQYEPGLQYQKPSLKFNKKIVAAILVVIALIGAGIGGYFYMDRKGRTINIEDYVEVTFDGCDGYGKATATLSDAFVTKVDEVAKKSDSAIASFGEMLSGSTGKMMKQTLTLTCDPNGSLKNGDTVTVSWNKAIAEKLADTYNVILEGENKKVKVKGLKEVEELDPFEGVKVEFSGIDGFIKATIVNENKDERLKNLYFHFDNGGMTMYNLKVGDSVTVSVDEQENLTSQGVRFKDTSKTYSVDSADRYATELKDINQEALSKMQSQAEDVLAAKGEDDDDFSYAPWEYVGNYVLARKNMNEYGTNNYVVLVYKGKLTLHDEYEKKEYHKTVYIPVTFQNVLVKADGTNSFDDTNAQIDYRSMNVHGFYYYRYGYENLKEIYKVKIKANKAEYNSDLSDAFAGYED